MHTIRLKKLKIRVGQNPCPAAQEHLCKCVAMEQEQEKGHLTGVGESRAVAETAQDKTHEFCSVEMCE